ncbi:hypothetical protein L1887_61081 [Cichorium endivia]|nr:hypothetical protein L1887_61081 [Cichorium endivia]
MVVIDVRLDIGLDIGLNLTLGVGLIRRSKGGIESVAVREGGIGAGTGWEQVRRRREIAHTPNDGAWLDDASSPTAADAARSPRGRDRRTSRHPPACAAGATSAPRPVATFVHASAKTDSTLPTPAHRFSTYLAPEPREL